MQNETESCKYAGLKMGATVLAIVCVMGLCKLEPVLYSKLFGGRASNAKETTKHPNIKYIKSDTTQTYYIKTYKIKSKTR